MMNLVLMGLSRLHKDEAGQGLVEYLLILALVAFAATAGMNNLATGLNSAFTRISQILQQRLAVCPCTVVVFGRTGRANRT